MNTKIEPLIFQKLKNSLNPTYLEVKNESHHHHVPPNSETHFKIVLVSNDFLNQNRIQRHQSVYRLTSEWMNNPIHALALHLFTEEEWEVFKTKNLDSPLCRGNK